MIGIELPLLAARAELCRRGEPHIDWLDYVRNSAIDIPTVCRFAGMIAVTHCVFYDHHRFDFADPAEREAEPAAVIEALGDDGETVIDLVAWPLERARPLCQPVRRRVGAGRRSRRQSRELLRRPASANLQDAAALAASRLHRRGGHRSAWRPDRPAARWGPIAGEDIQHARALQKLSHMPGQRVLAPLRAA